MSKFYKEPGLSEKPSGSECKNLEYSTENQSLKEVLHKRGDELPVVVRSVNSQPLPSRPSMADNLPQGVALLLEEVVIMDFAHIKILRYHDDREMVLKYGPEFVLIHDNYLGEEFLIPSGYRRKLTLTPRPGQKGRYVSARQIAEESPYVVRLEQQGRSEGLLGNTRMIPKHTKLTVTGVTRNHLKCTDENGRHIKFQLDTPMNCTYVPDKCKYTLQDILKMNLPKVAMFDINDVCDFEDDVVMASFENDELKSMLTGPIEVLGQVHMEILVSWSRDHTLKTFPTLLIPRRCWDKNNVCVRQFESENHKDDYIYKQFCPYLDSSFIKNHLYNLPTDTADIITLFHPDSSKFTFREFDDAEADDTYDDVKDEDTPPPTPPPRRRVTSSSQSSQETNETKIPETSKVERVLTLPRVVSKPTEVAASVMDVSGFATMVSTGTNRLPRSLPIDSAKRPTDSEQSTEDTNLGTHYIALEQNDERNYEEIEHSSESEDTSNSESDGDYEPVLLKPEVD